MIDVCETDCSEGKAGACVQLSRFFEFEAAPKNKKRALVFQEHACEFGHITSCVILGSHYLWEEDFLKSLHYYQKLCSLGDEAGCEWEQKLKSDEFKCFLPLMSDVPSCKRACDNRNAKCCLKMGEITRMGWRGVAKSRPLSNKYYKRACELGSHSGCFSVGHYYRVGAEQNQRDKGKAMAYFDKACTLRPPLKDVSDGIDRFLWGTSTSCLELGMMYSSLNNNDRPQSIERDVERGMYYMKRSCDLGLGMACHFFAETYWLTGKSDTEVVQEYYKKACHLGNKESCR